jgi:hypothetical protein
VGPKAPSGSVQKRIDRRLVWVWLLAVVASSCLEAAPPPTAPAIAWLTAEPQAASPGERVTLSWNVVGAASVTLDPGGVDVTDVSTMIVEPEATTVFVLLATAPSGVTSRQVEVRVGRPPRILAFGPDPGMVNAGRSATLAWVVEAADSLALNGPGLADGADVSGTSDIQLMAVPAGASYALVATNDFGAAEARADVGRPVPAVSLVVAGQSNAVGTNLMPAEARAFIAADEGVQMLGNDDVWKPAYEPLDDCTGQVDTVSIDGCGPSGGGPGVSFGVSAGNAIRAATDGEVFLIPAARGGSSADAWQPAADRYDRATLFGNAAHRATLADLERGAPLGDAPHGASHGAILWFQGETDSSSLSRTIGFRSKTDAIFDAFHAELDAPIIYAQLARRGPVAGDPDPTIRNLLYQRIRDEQRRMETGARELHGGPSGVAEPGRFMVVTHDLPMHPGDGRHLSAEGQVELGRRMALAIREHLQGEDVDGTGPRLVDVIQSSATELRVRADRPITAPATTDALAYAGYFAVFHAGSPLEVSRVELDPDDPTTVVIVLERPAEAGVEVRYMPPPGILLSFEPDVIRAATCHEGMPGTGACLPMPAFGVVADAAMQAVIGRYAFDDPR